MNAITLRPVTDGDRDLLIDIYQNSREPELALTPWTPELKRLFAASQLDGQLRHHREHYPQAEDLLIVVDDAPVGRLYLDRGSDVIALLDMTVLTESRNQGIGTHIVRGLQHESNGRSIRVFVETYNPSRLFF